MIKLESYRDNSMYICINVVYHIYTLFGYMYVVISVLV